MQVTHRSFVTPWWTIFICLWRLASNPNFFQQTSHPNFFSLSCTFSICRWSPDFAKKSLLQNWHIKSFPFSWTLFLCTFTSLFWAKFLPTVFTIMFLDFFMYSFNMYLKILIAIKHWAAELTGVVLYTLMNHPQMFSKGTK